MAAPKISVIIPVYNTAKYMDECMKSVLGQTFSDVEFILVDDGSTDGVSPGKCDEFAAKDKRVTVIHKENGGLISAWIAGTKRSCGDYLCYVDSDDWVDTDMLEKLYAKTDSSFLRSEIISGNYIVEKARERRKETQGLLPGEYKGEELTALRHRLMGNEVRPVTMSRCMKLISRDLVLNNIKYCNEKITMSEDVNIMLPCLLDCERLVIMKGSYFYHYRLVSESMAHDFNPKLLTNLELTDRTFRNIFREKGVSSGDAQMDREFVIMLHYILKNALRSPGKDTVALIKGIFLRPDIRAKIKSTPAKISGSANKLLYFCMKHPNALVISLTKAIIRAYDKRTN